MKRNLLLLSLAAVVAGLFFTSCGDPADPPEEVFVSKEAKNKIAILEEFTGVKCQFCPDGHVRANDIIIANPGKVMVIAYHPQSGSFNTPHGGDEDLRRTWPDPFWAKDVTAKSFSGSQAMPGAFIGRRPFIGNIRWTSRDKWAACVTTIIGEASPCNVGVSSKLDDAGTNLTVDVQVYYTAEVSREHTLYVVLTEDNIVTQQSTQTGLEPNYTHKRVFREGLSSFLGDSITGTKSVGYMFKKQYTFLNNKGYKFGNCNVVAFVRDVTNQEILTGNGAKVGTKSPM